MYEFLICLLFLFYFQYLTSLSSINVNNNTLLFYFIFYIISNTAEHIPPTDLQSMHAYHQQTQYLKQPQHLQHPHTRIDPQQNLSLHNHDTLNQEEPQQKQVTHTNPFLCSMCSHQAIGPVVAQCGHIYCWKCCILDIDSQVLVCQVCHQHIAIQKMRPIYVSAQQSHNTQHNRNQDNNTSSMAHKQIKNAHLNKSGHVPRPKATNSQPILNISNVARQDDQPQHQHLSNNISNNKVVAGVAITPCTAMLVFSRLRSLAQMQEIQASNRNRSGIATNRRGPNDNRHGNADVNLNQMGIQNQNYLQNMLDQNVILNPNVNVGHNGLIPLRNQMGGHGHNRTNNNTNNINQGENRGIRINILNNIGWRSMNSNRTVQSIKDIEYYVGKFQSCLIISLFFIILGILFLSDSL